MIDKKPTYISLFSGAGVGCYGFKQEGFLCIATNEYSARRLKVQEYNSKCMLHSGYICGDITNSEIKCRIMEQVKMWENDGNDGVDVLVATPPCQGMSVANHKKADDEIRRNSLVVESALMIRDIMPKFFVLENVPAFMKTECTMPDGRNMAIGNMLGELLGSDYSIRHRILNFKYHGAGSSRTRILVIGVRSDLAEYVSPELLFPGYSSPRTIREITGDLPPLEWGEICKNDFYHAFRTYNPDMRPWIHGMPEGCCAFDNEDSGCRPHRIVDGKYVPNARKNGSKYTRQRWDDSAPCIHTRNDQFASQNTIHPSEDRVFSIRELMRFMSIPDCFMWTDMGLDELNRQQDERKREIYRSEETNIRQCIGEAVPTEVFRRIAANIRSFLIHGHMSRREVTGTISRLGLSDRDSALDFIQENPMELDLETLRRIAEYSNPNRISLAAYCTDVMILDRIYGQWPEIEKDEIYVLEPSAGTGNFVPFLCAKYGHARKLHIDLCESDSEAVRILKVLVGKMELPGNVELNIIEDDFILHDFGRHYDFIAGNPPFIKIGRGGDGIYRGMGFSCGSKRTDIMFMEKSCRMADHVSFIMPKNLLNAPDYAPLRNMLAKMRVTGLCDFGETGFAGILVETICITVDTPGHPSSTMVESVPQGIRTTVRQKYIMDRKYPYWLPYRDSEFDTTAEKMNFGMFSVFRDRQITKAMLRHEKGEDGIRVLKSRNIPEDGDSIIDLPGYDSFMDREVASHTVAYRFVDDTNVFLAPNMTYKPRAIRNIQDMVADGSVAVLIPKDGIIPTDRQIAFFATDEFRKFYSVARNHQTRTLNIDTYSVFFFGLLKDAENHI